MRQLYVYLPMSCIGLVMDEQFKDAVDMDNGYKLGVLSSKQLEGIKNSAELFGYRVVEKNQEEILADMQNQENDIFLCEYDLAVRIHANLVGDLL
ncbi:hypothetical protein ACYEVY_003156 [Vibrio cholerae]|uniref:hypothetical protein n=1 Tax=Vibrio cholerae TaxID=666 RepID=UPI0028D921F2|nr:hypothetical protein [Vibrio cholerae]MDV2301081.1 hypothetical protein [Vibrio cholerae]HDL9501158.1 hypothetical protein [Vibrio cholerae]HDZ9239265.1 hypothetical protein [Vibrio cholerae]